MEIDYFKDFIVLVTAVICNRQGEILLLKRSSKNKTFRNFWQLPEGKIRFGEQPIQTLSRELKEELGLDLVSQKILLTHSTVISSASRKFHLLRLVFKAKTKGEINLSQEHSTSRWMEARKVSRIRRLFPGVKDIIRDLKKVEPRIDDDLFI